MQKETASIYGLKDQRNGEIFYIGMSTDPYTRYGSHVSLQGKECNSPKADRILDMRKDRLMPELVFIEEDIPIEDAYKREVYWIEAYRSKGKALTNRQLPSVNAKAVKPEIVKLEPMVTGDVKASGLREDHNIVTVGGERYLSMKACSEFLGISPYGLRLKCIKLEIKQYVFEPDIRIRYIKESDIPSQRARQARRE